MSPGVMVGVGICLIIVGYILRRIAGNSAKSPDGIGKLIEKAKTEENKNQIESAIEFHNSRVKAGADNSASLERLMGDVKRIGGTEEDPEPSQ